MTKTKKSYRDQLVQFIKEAGQELIDRAEDMVGEGTDLISDFNINISFDQQNYSVPTISYSMDVLCKNSIDRIMGITHKEKENENA